MRISFGHADPDPEPENKSLFMNRKSVGFKLPPSLLALMPRYLCSILKAAS